MTAVFGLGLSDYLFVEVDWIGGEKSCRSSRRMGTHPSPNEWPARDLLLPFQDLR